MTKKEKIRMASQIADAELVILKNANPEEVRLAKDKELNLMSKVELISDLDDIQALALTMIQEKRQKLGL